MKNGDIYIHHKGYAYVYDCLALPVKRLKDTSTLSQIGTARYHEDTHDIQVYGAYGIVFIDADVPHVIYASAENQRVAWAREVNDFFGYRYKGGRHVKTFSLKRGESL